MPELRAVFAAAGFADVVTALASGNVVFSARAASASAVARTAERAMQARLATPFPAFVRSLDELDALIAEDPFRAFRLPAAAKRVVTFLRAPPDPLPELPIALHEARILAVRGREVLSAYEPGPRGPVFMTLIERTFGKDVTTRTWDTVRKVAALR